jgi:hypothetical protein
MGQRCCRKWNQYAGQGVANYLITILKSGAANPKYLALAVATAYVEPMWCFLMSNENNSSAAPKIQLITSFGIY